MTMTYKKRNFLKSSEILNEVDEDYVGETKLILSGNLSYMKYKNAALRDDNNLIESMDYFLRVLRENEKNDVAINNLALILLNNREGEESEKVLDSYIERYPKLSKVKNSILELRDPGLNKHFLWKQLFSLSGNSFNPLRLILNLIKKIFSYPFIYYIFIFILYIKFLDRGFGSLGKSSTCSMCSKIIRRSTLRKSNKFCDDCHQLFLIKDVVFLEPKLLKEKEIKKRNSNNFRKIMFISLLIPGLNYNFKDKNKIFFILSIFFYFFIFFGFSGFVGFKPLGLPVPFIFNISGIIASALYLIINISSTIGEDYGV